jgi:hypothetical protein
MVQFLTEDMWIGIEKSNCERDKKWDVYSRKNKTNLHLKVTIVFFSDVEIQVFF